MRHYAGAKGQACAQDSDGMRQRMNGDETWCHEPMRWGPSCSTPAGPWYAWTERPPRLPVCRGPELHWRGRCNMRGRKMQHWRGCRRGRRREVDCVAVAFAGCLCCWVVTAMAGWQLGDSWVAAEVVADRRQVPCGCCRTGAVQARRRPCRGWGSGCSSSCRGRVGAIDATRDGAPSPRGSGQTPVARCGHSRRQTARRGSPGPCGRSPGPGRC